MMCQHQCRIGPDVIIDCSRTNIAPDCSVGVKTEANFRRYGGVLIRCQELELGPGCIIDRAVLITGGKIKLGPNCRIGAGVTIRVTESLELGKNSVIGEDTLIEGRKIKIGRDLWCGPYVRIGGGSCFEPQSELIAGYWLHLGMRVFINTARRVTIGNEVGLGTGTAIYTHGAYQSALRGYPVSFAPVTIGDNAWIPGATINPGVTIGAGAVIGVGSVVTRDIPAGALAAGVPCKVIRENAFPRSLNQEEKLAFWKQFLPLAGEILQHHFYHSLPRFSSTDAATALAIGDLHITYSPESETLTVTHSPLGEGYAQPEQPAPLCTFHLGEGKITGSVSPITEKLRDLLRRYGIRFKSDPDIHTGTYQPWSEDV